MILPLGKQVPTRETCERLCDAGFQAGTLCAWVYPLGKDERALAVPHDWGMTALDGYYAPIPAPTAAELGALLPTEANGHGLFHMPMLGGEYVAGYMDTENESVPGLRAYADTEAEARALLWLSLHSKGLLPDASYGSE